MSLLTNERIFSSSDFADEGFDRPRWGVKGSFYTTLRTKQYLSAVNNAQGNGNLTSTTGGDTSGENTTVREIVSHDASNGVQKLLVSAEQLVPMGLSLPLTIDDYQLSPDETMVLIFTNSKKVWRTKSRGSYWILPVGDVSRIQSLTALGSGESSVANDLLYATFSPDSSKVAFVKQNNIYVQSLLTFDMYAVTMDGSPNSIINGTFDWVYEEEFHLYRGYQWSPNSCEISYWQVDQSDVPLVHLVNNTDTLYPKVCSNVCSALHIVMWLQ